MAEIQLGGKRGGVALVDDEDVELVTAYRWHQAPTGHVRATIRLDTGYGTILMHRLLLPNVAEIDHVNRDPRDNRRCNLRAATHAENMKNRKMQKNNTSGYKGVYWEKSRQLYRVGIRLNGRTRERKRYHTAREAAEAYNEAALKYHGKFASLNVLD